jgi:hypothetical protein
MDADYFFAQPLFDSGVTFLQRPQSGADHFASGRIAA